MKPIIFIGEIGLDAIHLVAIVIALGLAAAIYRLNTQFGQERTTREEAEAERQRKVSAWQEEQRKLAALEEQKAREEKRLRKELRRQQRKEQKLAEGSK